MSNIPDTTTDPFASWFSNSKVRDARLAPLVCYHSSEEPIGEFAPFTHFGSIEAANRRASDKKIQNPVIHEVYLALTNPLEVHDDQVANNPLTLLDLPFQRGVLDPFDRQDLLAGVADAMGRAINGPMSAAEHTARKWHAGMSLLSVRLAQRGFDGLKYGNRLEGGTSFVNFRTDQVWQIGKANHD